MSDFDRFKSPTSPSSPSSSPSPFSANLSPGSTVPDQARRFTLLPFRSAAHLKRTIVAVAIALSVTPLLLLGALAWLCEAGSEPLPLALGIFSPMALSPTIIGLWLGMLGLATGASVGLAVYVNRHILRILQTLTQTISGFCAIEDGVESVFTPGGSSLSSEDSTNRIPSEQLRRVPPLPSDDVLERLDQAIEQSAQAAARLYLEQKQQADSLRSLNADLEEKFHHRTEQLYGMIHQLKQEVLERKQAEMALRQSQSKLIQTEKMSGLGHMVAGVAHEINNPITFIHGNLRHVYHHTQDILTVLEAYQSAYPDPDPMVKAIADELDLEFVATDLRKVVNSLRMGTDRILGIVQSLHTFSRIDQVEFKPTDIHSGLDSTLLILQHRLKPHGVRPKILVIKRYGKLPLVECHAGQINQVFMNILSNAIDALDEAGSLCAQKSEPPILIIQTYCVDGDRVTIKISDNGPGIPEPVQTQMFDPFFTTKPVGKGTGLGMSISYTIVSETHHGTLQVHSTVGQGAEFLIDLPIQQ